MHASYRRLVSASLLRIVFVLGLGAGAVVAAPQEPEPAPSCQATAERVLEPFLRRLDASERAAEEYHKKNAALIAELEKRIRVREGFAARFAEQRAAEDERFEQRIEQANAAIALAEKTASESIAKLAKALQEAEAAGRTREAEILRERLAKERAALAEGNVSAHSPGLGFGRSVRGWREYVTQTQKQQRERMALFAAGKVGLHHPEIGYGLDALGTAREIEEWNKRLAEARARKPAHHLTPLGFGLNGAGLDAYLAKVRGELADARARILAGTFRLHVPTLGYTTDRNGVQKLIHEAKQKYRDTLAAWAAKKYIVHNPLAGLSPTNGAIEEWLAAARKEFANYGAAGLEAVAHAAGRGQRGSDIQRMIQKAAEEKDAKGAEYHRRVLAEWQKNRDLHLKNLRERVERYEAMLKKHEELWREDLERQKEHIDGRLARALAETPCGGGAAVPAADATLVDEHLRKLRGLGEDEAEKQRRTERYLDRLHRERDGTVHGDPRDAWAHALSDLPVGQGQLPLPEWILWIKDQLDWLEGFADADEIRAFGARIDEFVRSMEALDPSQMSKKEFFERRKQLRATLKGIEEALEGGLLSPGRLRGYIDAVVKGGSESKKTRQQLAQLRTLLRHSEDAKRMFTSWGAMRSVATQLGGEALEAYQGFVHGSASQLAARTDGWWAAKSKLDKGLFVFSLMAAAANAYQQTQQGVAPSEAIARASVDFVLDLVIGGVPVLAAAEMGTQVLFTSYAAVTGDKGVSDATLSNTAKWAARQALDTVAAGSAELGRLSIALERFASGDPSVREILDGVDFARLRQSLSRVEERLDMLPPGHPDEARLLRARQAFRRLLRAKQGLEY